MSVAAGAAVTMLKPAKVVIARVRKCIVVVGRCMAVMVAVRCRVARGEAVNVCICWKGERAGVREIRRTSRQEMFFEFPSNDCESI